MAKTYVVEGAKLKCTCGSAATNLKVPIDHNASIKGKAQGNIKDSRPNINIQAFGPCANRPHHKPCDLQLTSQWTSGKTDVQVGDAPALLNSSKLRCNRGGIISIVDPGQQLDKTGAAPVTYQMNTQKLAPAKKKFIRGEVYQKNHNPFLGNGKDVKIGSYGDVCPGDTLETISKQVYGERKLWPIIADINGIIDPQAIQPGQTLYIPDLLKITTNTEETVTFTPIDYSEFQRKIRTTSPMFIQIVLENNLCYLCASPPKEDKRKDDINFLNSFCTYSGGDIASLLNTGISAMTTIGTAKRYTKQGQTFFVFAKGSLSQLKKVTQALSEFKVTIIRTGLRGFWLTSFIFGLYDGLMATINENGNLAYGGYIIAKSIANSGISAAGGILGGLGVLAICGTAPGWFVGLIVIGAGVAVLWGVNQIENYFLSDWEKKTFKLKD